MSSGVTCDQTCVSIFEDFKLNKKVNGKKLRAITFMIEGESKIVVDQTLEKTDSCEADFEKFRSILPTDNPRYAVFDIHYTTSDGRPQDKIVFVFWSPDNAGIKPKMLAASSKDAIRQSLQGIAKEFQANDMDDLNITEVKAKCQQV